MPMTPAHPLWKECGGGEPYSGLTAAESVALPRGESLQACHVRVAAYVNEAVAPALRKGRTVLVAAHNNVLRALMVHLDGADPKGPGVLADIPKAVPIVYALDCATLRPLGTPGRHGCTHELLSHELDETTPSGHQDPLRDDERPDTRIILRSEDPVALSEVLSLACVRREACAMGVPDGDVPMLAAGSALLPA